jgi:hypothetical protein
LAVDFFLFLLVNATLFIRPAELIPATAGWPIYNVVIVIALIVAAPAIIKHLSDNGLTRSPTTTCALGVLAFVMVSHLARFDFWYARYNTLEFSKVIAYFLLLMATVTTTKRLFTLLATVVALTLFINVLAVIDYQGIVDVPTISAIMEGDYNELTGEAFQVARMRATGIFQDPNDLSMIIVASIAICAGGLFYKRLGGSRFLLAAPIGFLGYALTLTQSRGGLLALLAGCCMFLYSRFGMMRSALVGAAAVPVLLAGFSGRQVDFGGAISGGTGHQRAEFWSNGLVVFKQNALFGVGQGMFQDHNERHVAHNSFVEAFVELGFFGGITFLGLFGIVGWSLWSMRGVRYQIDEAALRHFLPYMIALLAAYCVAMMSLSRTYVVPTYLVAGTAAAYERLARPGTSLPPVQMNGKLLAWLCVAGVGFIAFIYYYIKILYRMG